jgi:hypothetical protein
MHSFIRPAMADASGFDFHTAHTHHSRVARSTEVPLRRYTCPDVPMLRTTRSRSAGSRVMSNSRSGRDSRERRPRRGESTLRRNSARGLCSEVPHRRDTVGNSRQQRLVLDVCSCSSCTSGLPARLVQIVHILCYQCEARETRSRIPRRHMPAFGQHGGDALAPPGIPTPNQIGMASKDA